MAGNDGRGGFFKDIVCNLLKSNSEPLGGHIQILDLPKNLNIVDFDSVNGVQVPIFDGHLWCHAFFKGTAKEALKSYAARFANFPSQSCDPETLIGYTKSVFISNSCSEDFEEDYLMFGYVKKSRLIVRLDSLFDHSAKFILVITEMEMMNTITPELFSNRLPNLKFPSFERHDVDFYNSNKFLYNYLQYQCLIGNEKNLHCESSIKGTSFKLLNAWKQVGIAVQMLSMDEIGAKRVKPFIWCPVTYIELVPSSTMKDLAMQMGQHILKKAETKLNAIKTAHGQASSLEKVIETVIDTSGNKKTSLVPNIPTPNLSFIEDPVPGINQRLSYSTHESVSLDLSSAENCRAKQQDSRPEENSETVRVGSNGFTDPFKNTTADRNENLPPVSAFCQTREEINVDKVAIEASDSSDPSRIPNVVETNEGQPTEIKIYAKGKFSIDSQTLLHAEDADREPDADIALETDSAEDNNKEPDADIAGDTDADSRKPDADREVNEDNEEENLESLLSNDGKASSFLTEDEESMEQIESPALSKDLDDESSIETELNHPEILHTSELENCAYNLEDDHNLEPTVNTFAISDEDRRLDALSKCFEEDTEEKRLRSIAESLGNKSPEDIRLSQLTKPKTLGMDNLADGTVDTDNQITEIVGQMEATGDTDGHFSRTPPKRTSTPCTLLTDFEVSFRDFPSSSKRSKSQEEKLLREVTPRRPLRNGRRLLEHSKSQQVPQYSNTLTGSLRTFVTKKVFGRSLSYLPSQVAREDLESSEHEALVAAASQETSDSWTRKPKTDDLTSQIDLDAALKLIQQNTPRTESNPRLENEDVVPCAQVQSSSVSDQSSQVSGYDNDDDVDVEAHFLGDTGAQLTPLLGDF